MPVRGQPSRGAHAAVALGAGRHQPRYTGRNAKPAAYRGRLRHRQTSSRKDILVYGWLPVIQRREKRTDQLTSSCVWAMVGGNAGSGWARSTTASASASRSGWPELDTMLRDNT